MDPLLRADLDSEWYLGATNINGTVGNGRLTVGVSLWGELTVLRWPSVSHCDQLRYRTSHGFPLRNYGVRWGEDAPSASYSRWGKPVVLSGAMGSFGGLLLEGEGRTTWFHDPGWEPAQRYEPEHGNTLLTRASHSRLGVSVEITDTVDPDRDVLARRFAFESVHAAPPTRARFIYYANFSPTLARARYYPVSWRLHERRSDFMALYDARDDLVLHFMPGGRGARADARRTAARMLDAPGLIGGYIDGLDSSFPGDGAYVAWGGDPHSESHDVGCDHATPGGGRWNDAYAASCLGSLGGHAAAPRPAAAALSYSLELGPETRHEVTVYIAVAGRASVAAGLLDDARSVGFERLDARSRSRWTAFSKSVRVPAGVDRDSDSARVARRGILALGVGTDRVSGAIVASVSRQPQYCFDWPRDGAFFDYALDLAGLHDAATRHALFYARVQVKRKRFGCDAGHFEGHYYADGSRGPLPFFEIDETGLAAWDLWRHARYLDGRERDDYLAEVYPSIGLAADALLAMRPRGGGFPRRAREDDNLFRRTRTLHGATSTLLGLEAAASAGTQANEDSRKVEAWLGWAGELRHEIARRYDPAARRFADEGWRGGTWIIWPGRILPLDDERVQRQADHLMREVEPFIRKESRGAAYVAEKLLACALAWRGEPGKLERVRSALLLMAGEVVTPGTGHLGEVTLVGDFAGDGERAFQNRTSIPHLWEGTLLYLAFAAAYSPGWFDRADGPFSW